jgi:hypothetical protein
MFRDIDLNKCETKGLWVYEVDKDFGTTERSTAHPILGMS